MGIPVNIKNNTSKYYDRTTTLVDYFRDIQRLDTDINSDDEAILFDYIKNGSSQEKTDAKHILTEANQKFVVSVARSYGTNNDLMDLIDEGNIGLMEAIDAYDPNIKVNGKNVRFITFAVHYIRRAIHQYKANNDSLVRRTNISKTWHTLSRAKNKFIQEYGRQPSSEELRIYANKVFGINIKHSSDVLDVKFTYIDAASDDDDENHLSSLATFNAYSANGNAFDDATERDYKKELTSSLLDCLTPREQTIIKLSFGIGELRPYTPSEISDRLGITTERVRQLKDSSLKRLKKAFARHLDNII